MDGVTPDEQGGVWGPLNPSALGVDPDEPREKGAQDWVTGCLIAYYFLKNDNKRSTIEEIEEWIFTLTPRQVQEAVDIGVRAGLP